MIRIKWKREDSDNISQGMMLEADFTYQCSIHTTFVLETQGVTALGWYDRDSGMTTWTIIDFKEKI